MLSTVYAFFKITIDPMVQHDSIIPILKPIGILKSASISKFQLTHQPDGSNKDQDLIELFPNNHFEIALRDLDGFDYIWVIWLFHKNKDWRPLVRPPRGSGEKRGVFATRSPHRPNPIGMSALPLLNIQGRNLTVGKSDLLDGTPILDIKPYIPNIDSFPNASSGWVEEVERELSLPPVYSISLSLIAQEQIDWLKVRGVNFFIKAFEILARYPTPNRTRRILKLKDGELRMGCGGWRLFFNVSDKNVLIHKITVGYNPITLKNFPIEYTIPDRDVLTDFLEKWE